MNQHTSERFHYVTGLVDGQIRQIRLPASVMEALMPKKPAPPPPPPHATNGIWTVGDRVKPIGWTNADTGEPTKSVATVVEVSEHGVKVRFDSGEPFHFVNECIENA
jgi:hypothetical protein